MYARIIRQCKVRSPICLAWCILHAERVRTNSSTHVCYTFIDTDLFVDVVGLFPNQTTCFSAISRSGEWLGPVTPVIAGPSLLYAAAQRYLYGMLDVFSPPFHIVCSNAIAMLAWRDAPPAPPPPHPSKLKLWEILALAVGGPLLFIWLICAVAYLSLRESPQEEEVSLLRPI